MNARDGRKESGPDSEWGKKTWRPNEARAGQAWREDKRIFLEGQWAGLAGPELLSPESRWKQP